ncbi:MAG TPA: ATP-binding protein [Conexibacter sp.]|nr:ATP-binding protein [Conexibacter sp.]
MDPFVNPYRPSAGAAPPALVGRDELTADFETIATRAVRGRPGQSFIPTGLRGVGKTVLLNRFSETAEALGLAVAFLEATDDDDFRRALATRLRTVLLKLDRGKASRAVKRALGALESFTYQLPDGSTLSLNISALAGVADSGQLTDDLTDLLIAVGEAARDRNTGVVLMIDEIQLVARKHLSALIIAVHRTVQLDLPIVLTGAGLPQLPGLTGKARSYAERLFEFPFIGNLAPDDARDVLVIPAREQGVAFTDTALALLEARTLGYPFFLQVWGYEVWNVAPGSPIGVEDVTRSAPRVRRKLDENFFRVRMERLTPTERRYLFAMARLGAGPHRSGDVAAELGAPVERVAPRRASLIRKGMIYSPAHGDTAFTVPMFDEFLRREQASAAPGQVA